MAFEDWAKAPDGNVRACPLLGYDVASFAMNGIVRIEYAEGPEDLRKMSGKHLQLGMTGPQARELGEAMIRLADRIATQPLGTKQ